ncbi:MAG: hypothetical protein MJA31_14885 [Clostridia bacterium]|nr:hypothetical protein [Clostridia bacterium]
MENYSKKKYVLIVAFLLIILAVIPETRALLTVKVYKEMNKNESILKTENIDFEIPSGASTASKDWMPIMIWYHDKGGFSRLMGKELDMTVLYSFGAFDSLFGSSSYYNEKSPYYGAFYGGYAIKDMANPEDAFGFNEDGSIIPHEVESVPKYDQKYLVLPALGCPKDKRVFETQIISIQDHVDYAGYNGWTRVDSSIYTNGPAHESSEFNIGYLQYGKPLKPVKSKVNFQPQWFKGRMYIRYFDDIKMTICLYVICKDEKQINLCDDELLSHVKIKP